MREALEEAQGGDRQVPIGAVIVGRNRGLQPPGTDWDHRPCRDAANREAAGA